MNFEISPCRDKRDLREFVNLPFRLYPPESSGVGSLIRQDMRLLDSVRHPFWRTARRELFLARENGKAVGRIAAIIDEKFNSYAHEKCGAFGFFECVDDREIAHALLDRARSWHLEQGMKFMRGPLNPSTNYTCGMLVSGFEYPPVLMMPWNPPWYPRLLETYPLFKEQDLFAYLIEREKLSPPEWLAEDVARLREENRFSFRTASKATMAGDIRSMLEIYRVSWANNWGFSPLSKEEADELVHELKGIVDPEFFVLFFHGDEPAAGMVALPDLNPLLKRLRGRLGLSTIWHWWQSRQQIRRGYRIMLFGIKPEYRLLGLPLLLFDYLLKTARKRPDLEWVEGSWVLEDNNAICDLIEDFGGVIQKRYRIYRQDIRP